MRIINRTLSKRLKGLSLKFPVIALVGPRQSGKTTLVRHVFTDYNYISLEEPDNRLFAQQDPRGFLNSFTGKIIIDEAQRVPDLFSYIQTKADDNNINGQFILTGSQNFLLHEKIYQSLAGRVAILKLLPFTIFELKAEKIEYDRFEENIFNGFYPPLYKRKLKPEEWFPNYVHTYLEKDVRQIKNILDLGQFHLFLKMCAGRVGQQLNLSSLAADCGISHTTARSWISLLESSFIIFLQRPYYKNFNKRLTKMPKLYFYDIGLATFLLGIKSSLEIQLHYAKGALFENFVIAELMKHQTHLYNNPPEIYYYRDKRGHEVDCLIDYGAQVKAIEIKASQTISGSFFKELLFWNELSNSVPEDSYLVYGGSETQKRTKATVVSWKNLEIFFKQ